MIEPDLTVATAIFDDLAVNTRGRVGIFRDTYGDVRTARNGAAAVNREAEPPDVGDVADCAIYHGAFQPHAGPQPRSSRRPTQRR